MNSLLSELTPEQTDAVTHVDGPLMILAGPGSGKTRVITHRIAYLLEQGAAARQVLALTFTNKAADEMRGRVAELAPGAPVWMSTFHRFCARLLRRHAALVGLAENFTIYDAYDARKALQRTLEDLHIESLHTPQRIAAAISHAKNRMATAEAFQPRPGNPEDAVLATAYPAYQQRLMASAAVDFDDLLLYTAVLLRENPEVRATLDERYRYIMVDEYQDTNLVQYAIVRALSIDHTNLAVTGDPDQSIYGWRGANLNNILKFEDDFPDVVVVRLERNYRSTKRILHVADQLIVHNNRRKVKGLYTENVEGRPARLVSYEDQQDEARSIAARIAADVASGRRRPRDFAVFYRVNALSRVLEDAIREQGLPYQIVRGQEFYQRKEIKDVVAYLQLINNPADDGAFLRVINTPPRGIGKTTIGHLRRHAARRRMPLLDAARECGLIEEIMKRAATKIIKFAALQDRLREKAAASVEEVLGYVLEETGYRRQLAESQHVEDQDRVANIDELLTAARQFDERHPDDGGLEAFLEQASLVNDTDDWEAETDKVTLMTLHAAKGLEFPVVFVVAVEDGLVPHERSRTDPIQIEEERRLLFVGITRAREELELSWAVRRDFRGQRRRTVPSSFFWEIPRAEMEIIELGQLVRSPETALPDPPRRKRKAARFSAAVATAAEFAQRAEAGAEPLSPDDFYQGMAVVHPQYSLGKIIALSGSGARRMATVAFATAGEKKMILQQSALRPARRKSK